MGLWPFGKKEEEKVEEPQPSGPQCSFCGEAGADKKWAGQYFHKKCLRKARKMAKGMV